MEAVICPICKGEGTLCVGLGCEFISTVFGTSGASEHILPVLKPCHGCGGKGWVVIPEYTLTYRPGRQLQGGDPIPWKID